MTYIERKALPKPVELECLDRESFKPRTVRVKAYLAEDVDKLPAADVVKVVRCKDCKHYCYDKESYDYYCEEVEGLVLADIDSFCSYGEKREG